MNVTMHRIEFAIQIEMDVPQTNLGDKSLRNEVSNIINNSLQGIHYWDYVEGGEPKVIESRTLQFNGVSSY